MELLGPQQGQLRDPPGGVFGQGLEQDHQGAGEARGGGGVEQIGAVVEGDRQRAVRQLHGLQLEVEPRGRHLLGQPGEGEPGQLHRAPGRVLQHADDLEQRVEGQAPLGAQLLHQAVEGQVLVGVGLQGLLAHPRQQAGERRVSRHLAPQDQHVDEEADQRLDLRPVAVGDRRAQGEVPLAGDSPQVDLEGGEQDHEQGRLAAAGQPPQPRRDLRADAGVHERATPGRPRRARAVERQVDAGRHAGQPFPPVGELALELAL